MEQVRCVDSSRPRVIRHSLRRSALKSSWWWSHTVKDLSYERIAVEEYEDMKRRSVMSDDEKTVCAILENK